MGNDNLVINKPVTEQLVDMYNEYMDWDKHKLQFNEAFRYFNDRLNSSNIVCYIENWVVLGYYERYCYNTTCFLCNVIIRKDARNSKVFKELYSHFFKTLPENITEIIGEHQKTGGKLMKRFVNRRRVYGD